MNKTIPNETHNYRPDIDGLRAVAILLVVVFHAFPKMLPGGFLGVDVFFVISGFLITRNILNDISKGTFSFLNFYGKRCRRILPALFAVLISISLFGYFFFEGALFNRLGKHLVGGTLFFSNFLLLRESGYFDSASELKPLLHLWTLSVEEQFYIAWPLLAFLAFTRSRFWAKIPVALAILSFYFCIDWSLFYKAKAFYSILSRFWELALGCGLAFLFINEIKSKDYFFRIIGKHRLSLFRNLLALTAIMLLILSQLCVNQDSNVPGFWALAPTLATVFLIQAGQNSFISKVVLSNRLMTSLGLISYPLYLWHWPLLVILRTRPEFNKGPLPIAITVIFSVFLSILTWKFIELPIQRYFNFRKKSFWKGPKFALSAAAGISLSLSIFGFLIYKERLPSRDQVRNPISYKLQRYSFYNMSSTRLGSCFIDTNQPFLGFPRNCYEPKDSAKPFALLIGDSIAAHLYPGLDDILRRHQKELLQLNASSCIPFIENGPNYVPSCAQANQFIFGKIQEIRPSFLIIAINWLMYPNKKLLRLDLLGSLLKYKKLGVKKIIIIGVGPQYSTPLFEVLDKNFIRKDLPLPAATKIGLNSSLMQLNIKLSNFLRTPEVTYIDLLNSLCTNSGCLTFVGPDIATDLLLYDQDHFTASASRYISERYIYPVLEKLY